MNLNREQTKAVNSTAELTVVIAGPGSGKTRVEVERVNILCASELVAVMTFTNAAANEFRERLGEIKPVYCGTLHSYCFKLLQKFAWVAGYRPLPVAILPEGEKLPRLIAEKAKQGSRMSQATLLERATPDAELIWREYEFMLKQNNLVDYDGILQCAVQLLGREDVRARIQLDHLLVDEYQDSAAIDQTIYDLIPAANKFYCGDPDQSIFFFRGANPNGLVELTKRKGAKVIKLEQNYRSDTSICEAANKLIAHNQNRVDKTIKSVSKEPGKVSVAEWEDCLFELRWVASEILSNPDQSVAVLCRNNYEAQRFYQYLLGTGLSMQQPRWVQQPPDWDRALLLLSLLLAPENEILAERFLKLDHYDPLVDRWVLESRALGEPLSHKIMPLIMPLYGDWWSVLARHGVSESTIHLIKRKADELPTDSDLADLVHDLHQGPEQEPPNGGIYVGTMHSAKGREWDVVFLPAFEQGIIPNLKLLQLANPSALEEDRRLAFVALTRARHQVYLSWSKQGKGKWGPRSLGQPSQFISEMGL